jgi:NAD(P)-dependent dehydrogenase (short-subunit alcohol dehydrogenase family)
MSDAFDLSSRTALVTGGAKGLGYAMARAFASHGADLFICGRDGTELERVAGELRSEHGRGVEFAVSDLATRQGIDQLVSEVERQIGAIDILVNNAGGGRPQPIDEVDD